MWFSGKVLAWPQVQFPAPKKKDKEIKTNLGTIEMTQVVKTLAGKADDLSLIPRTLHMVEGENLLLQFTHMHAHSCAHTHTVIFKIGEKAVTTEAANISVILYPMYLITAIILIEKLTRCKYFKVFFILKIITFELY